MDEQERSILNKRYNNIISLGFFCSVAQELEKYGFRNASYPFDWLISDFKGVIEVIERDFKDFLNYDYLSQMAVNPKYYINTAYGFQFYHDFNAYQPLSTQLNDVRKKYNRRINRFYKNITKPTLFVRYIENEVEFKWIEENYIRIRELLKSFNPNKEIVYITNDEYSSTVFKAFYVEKDEGDTVARQPFSKSEELMSFFKNVDYLNNEKSTVLNLRKRLIRRFRTIKSKLNSDKNNIEIYIHEKQYPST
ncbi:MAG: hypothetical protein IJS03_06790 [Eubacterium sp.]|nr:hypothetical protein [Eubacterium sp.]